MRDQSLRTCRPSGPPTRPYSAVTPDLTVGAMNCRPSGPAALMAILSILGCADGTPPAKPADPLPPLVDIDGKPCAAVRAGGREGRRDDLRAAGLSDCEFVSARDQSAARGIRPAGRGAA